MLAGVDSYVHAFGQRQRHIFSQAFHKKITEGGSYLIVICFLICGIRLFLRKPDPLRRRFLPDHIEKYAESPSESATIAAGWLDPTSYKVHGVSLICHLGPDRSGAAQNNCEESDGWNGTTLLRYKSLE